jgi:hypothetical protein
MPAMLPAMVPSLDPRADPRITKLYRSCTALAMPGPRGTLNVIGADGKPVVDAAVHNYISTLGGPEPDPEPEQDPWAHAVIDVRRRCAPTHRLASPPLRLSASLRLAPTDGQLTERCCVRAADAAAAVARQHLQLRA